MGKLSKSAKNKVYILYQLSFSPERSDSFGPFAIQAFQCLCGQRGHAPGPRQRCISFCQYVAFKNTSCPYELYFALWQCSFPHTHFVLSIPSLEKITLWPSDNVSQIPRQVAGTPRTPSRIRKVNAVSAFLRRSAFFHS